MQVLKNYFGITNKGYRLLWNLAIPGAIALGSIIVGYFFQFVGLLMGPCLLLTAEMICDFFGFGGMCKKDSHSMEYIQTSFWGDKILKDALLIDILVRPLRVFLFGGAACILGVMDGYPVKLAIIYILIIAIFSVAAVNATRYFTVLQYYFFLAGGAGALYGLVLYNSYRLEEMWMNISIGAGAALVIILVFVTYCHMISTIKNSYKDN